LPQPWIRTTVLSSTTPGPWWVIEPFFWWCLLGLSAWSVC
jgi:hypothetical protein